MNITPQRASVSHSHGPLTARSAIHKPSPLSFSQNNVVASPITPTLKSPTVTKAPNSPLAAPPVVASKSTDSDMTLTSAETQSESTPSSPVSIRQSRSPVISRTEAVTTTTTEPTPEPSAPTRHLRHSRSSISHKGSTTRDLSPQSRGSMQGRRSGDTDISHYSDARSVVSPAFSPPLSTVPLGREPR